MNFTFIAGLGYTANAATPDTTAPTLSNPNDGTPTSDGCTSPSVDTDEGNGTMYWAVLTNGGSCTDAQLKAGSGGNIVAGKAGNQAVSGTGTQTTSNVTGLSASTNYEIVFLHRDAAGNDSSQATVGLTTTAGGAFTEIGSGSQRAIADDGNFQAFDTLAFPGSVTSGNLLIVAGRVQQNDGLEPVLVTDTVGTTYTVMQTDYGGFWSNFIAYGIANASGANTVRPALTNEGNNGFFTYVIDEFSAPNATPLDVNGGSSAGTSTTPSDSITTVAANALIIGVYSQDNTASTGAITENDGTLIGEFEDGSANNRISVIFVTQETAGARTIDWTLADSSAWVVRTASFVPA